MENVIKHLKDYTKELKEERDEYKADYKRMVKIAEDLAKENERLRDVNQPIPLEEWHEDEGDVLWWVLPVEEPPYCGTPMDKNFKGEYYTHFTRLIVPEDSDQ